MQTDGEAEVQLHALLTSALDGVEWSPLRAGRFTPEERAPGSHWTGGWMGYRAGLVTLAKTIHHCPCRELNPGRHYID